MPLSVSTFLDTIERSGLVDKSQLAQSLTELERVSGSDAANDSLIVSDHLGRAGLITPWQTKRLLEGRYAGYFLGKYKLLDHLGSGGMSCVYLAEHPLMRRRVAIKVLPKNLVHDSSYLARFHREARAVASLDHPNIVRAFDVDNDGDVHYIVMEYIEGHDLKVAVERQGPLAYRTAADYIRQAADGLAHAHQAGVVHRDVKPANLLIDNKQVVKVLDMGLARTSDDIDASLTKDFDERMLGTVDYLAPEQALDSHLVDPRADIYSLGCTLYFSLSGRPPFPEGTLAQRVLMHQTREPEPLGAKRPDVPPTLEAIYKRMMAKSPAARYQTAGEVSAALTEWIQRFDCGETSAPVAARHADSDEELSLAPLDDEPRGHAPVAKPAARISSASEASRAAKGDATTVQRRESAKPVSGSSIKLAPTDPPAKTTHGSSIKGRSAKPQSTDPAKGKGGSSIKGGSGKAAERPVPRGSPEPGAADAIDLSAAGGVELPDLLPAPLSGDGLLDGLLSDPLLSDSLLSGPLLSGPLLSGPTLLSSSQPNPLAGSPLSKSAAKPKSRRSLWESTWFLILIGTLLGAVLAAMIVFWRSMK